MGLPTTGIIDAHVHLYPAEASADPAAWARTMREPLWGDLVADRPDRRVRQGWADGDRLLRDMDAAGVAHAVLLGWYWEQLETCVWQNRYYAACVRRHPDRLSGFATVQAGGGATALDEMRRARDDGLIGLGEMCPWAFGVSPLDAAWLEVFALAAELHWPVNLHVSDPAGRRYAGRVETPLADVVELAETVPELRLILAHLGGGLVFHELSPRVRRALRSAVYDTAAAPLLYRTQAYQLAAEVVGADRILFGSDYPLMVFPATQREPDFISCLDQLKQAVPDPAAFRMISGDAARRFFAPEE